MIASGVVVGRTVFDPNMASKQYPQFLLVGDSIVQYSGFLRDGFSFGAALEERESMRLLVLCALPLVLSHSSRLSLQTFTMLQQSDSC